MGPPQRNWFCRRLVWFGRQPYYLPMVPHASQGGLELKTIDQASIAIELIFRRARFRGTAIPTGRGIVVAATVVRCLEDKKNCP